MILEGLESGRLRYRSLAIDDYEALLPFFKSKEATRYYRLKEPPEATCKAWIERQLQRYEKDGYGLCALIEKTTNQLVGQCGLLKQVVDDTEELEIGYLLIPAFWSRGFAAEAARFFRDFAFERQMAPSIISIIDTGNINSQKVAYNNGMKIDKETKFKDMQVYIYRITSSEWKQGLQDKH